jgi:hypothetical protein
MKCTFSIFFLLLLLTMPMAADAQSCTTAVCNATGTSESAFLAALPSSGNTNATVVVNIPVGSSSWTTGFNYTVPSAVTSLTIQGATTITWSGTAGTSNYTDTATDNTTITDAWANTNSLITFTINGTNTLFRWTGITLNAGTTGDSKYGELTFGGNSQSFRLDHSHFIAPQNTGAMVRVAGPLGVMDHNVVDSGSNTNLTNGFQAFDPASDTIGLGDGTFAAATPWGTANALYIENNYFNGGAPNDCYQGGFFVMRYNTINSAYVGIQTHGTKSTGGPYRACRGYEAYHNYFTGPSSSPASGSTGAKGATALIWGNLTSQNAAYRFFEAAGDRNSGDENETTAPSGWGYCGTAVNGNGVGSPWDGNQSNGYPCLDGIGRGQSQALNGAVFPSRVDSVTGTITWPQQKLEPVYMWNNTMNSGGTAATYVLIQDSVTQNNRDYYYDCGAGNSGCSGSFTGAAGTGYGPISSRPSTCTPGAGGTYYASPTGSYGVAYFATDVNNGNGELYVCFGTNTWKGIYQPYTYPHPLVSGNTTTAAAPAPPTNLRYTMH